MPAEHDVVDTSEILPVLAKALAHDALESRALNCSGCASLGDDKTESCSVALVGARENGEVVVDGFSWAGEDAPIFPRATETGGSWKARSRWASSQGIRRTRPFARRAFNTFRPFLVAMRARKPWVRARFRRLGWKVLFMDDNLGERAAPNCNGKDKQRRAIIFFGRSAVNAECEIARIAPCG